MVWAVATNFMTGRALILCSLYVYNKIDSVSIEFLDKLAREPNTAVMSCEMNLGVQDVVDRCWEELRLIRCYTKRYGKHTMVEPHTNHSTGKVWTQTSTKHSLCGRTPLSKMSVTKSIAH